MSTARSAARSGICIKLHHLVLLPDKKHFILGQIENTDIGFLVLEFIDANDETEVLPMVCSSVIIESSAVNSTTPGAGVITKFKKTGERNVAIFLHGVSVDNV